MPSGVLVSHIDSKPVSPSVSPKTCSAECTLCAQVHTAVYNPPHTIQTLRMHPCTAVAESSTTPTQCCVMTAKQPSPAAPHTVAHSRPSPCTRIHTHVSRTPDVASRPYIAQVMPASRRSQYCNKPVAEIHPLYTRIPPCPRKSSCPKYVQSYHHPFAAAKLMSTKFPMNAVLMELAAIMEVTGQFLGLGSA